MTDIPTKRAKAREANHEIGEMRSWMRMSLDEIGIDQESGSGRGMTSEIEIAKMLMEVGPGVTGM